MLSPNSGDDKYRSNAILQLAFMVSHNRSVIEFYLDRFIILMRCLDRQEQAQHLQV